MEELIPMEKVLDYKAISMTSIQDGTALSINCKPRKEEIFNNYFNKSLERPAEMVVIDEIDIKEEPIEYYDTAEMQHEMNENELVPTNDYIKRKGNESIQFYEESKKLKNSNESSIIENKEKKGSEYYLDPLCIPQNISNSRDNSIRKSNPFFTEKTQCVIPLKNGFSQFIESDKCGQTSGFRELRTINQPVTTEPLGTETIKDYQGNTEILKGKREDLIAQAVNSVLSSLKLPAPNVLTQLKSSDRSSPIEYPSDPLKNKYALDSNNLSQNVNKRPNRTSKESAKMRISDSLIEECDSQTNRKKFKVDKSKQANDLSKLKTSDKCERGKETASSFQRQNKKNKSQNQGSKFKDEPQISEILDIEGCGWNWETNINSYERQDCHSPEHKDKFSISDDNDGQEINIKKISKEDVPIENIKKENSNSEDSIDIENNRENNYLETYSIKPKMKIKRRKWTPGEDGMYACNLCSYKAKKPPCLKKHMITHAIDKPYTCHICNKSLCSYNSLKMHLEMHNGIKNYHCSLCGNSFRQKVHLKTHMSKHHSKSNKQPNQHLNTNEEPPISKTLDIDDSTITSEMDKNDSYMQPESERQDTRALKAISDDEGSKDVELNKSSATTNIITDSSIDTLGDPLIMNNDLEVNNTSQNINKSPGINDKISKEKNMSDSLIKESDSLKKTRCLKTKPYTCNICNKSLCSYNSLKMHLDIHNGIKNYHCSLCDNSFRQKVHLKAHMSKYHKESNKQPNQCLSINEEPQISKILDINDSTKTISELDKNDSYMQPESDRQDTRALKAISINEFSKDVELNKSRATLNLFTESSIDTFGDSLMINNDLEVNNTSQNINKSPGINDKISKEKHMSDSLIKEPDSLKNAKCLKTNELAECGWNWQTNFNDYKRQDYHSPEDKDELSISVENDVQKNNIDKLSEQNVPIENIKMENINCDVNVDIESNIGSKYVETNSIKPVVKKVKKKRQRWIPGEDGMYACKLCSYKAKRAPYLKRHMITHTNEKPYNCHICDKRFNHYNSLKYHLDVHNDMIHGIRKYHCPLCEYSFIQKGHLKSHMLQHSREEREQGGIIESQSQGLKIIEESRRSEIDKNGSYVEPTSGTHYEQLLKANSNGESECSKDIELNETRSSENLLKDSSIKPLGEPLMINYDLDALNTSQNISKSPGRSYKISEEKHITDSVVEEYDSLNETKFPKNNELKECNMNWQTNINNRKNCHLEDRDKISISEEIQETFIQGNNINNISTEAVPIENIKKENSNCEDSINIENDIVSNYKETFLIKRKKKKVYRWIAGEDGMYACNLCSYKAKQAPYLKRHLITHLIDKPYKCHICVKSFCSYNSLKMHLDMHNGVKNYHCSLCDYSFIQKVHLKTHMIKHTGEKKYQCEYCEKKFSRRDHLRTHIVTHSDERPFACDECDLKFKNKSNLYHHKRNHANDRKYKCQECDASFMLSNTLRGHLASHLVYRKGCKVCPECPLFFWSPSQFISHLSKRHGYTTEEGEQILKKFISETNFRFYRKNKKKKKIVSKKLGENVKSACNISNTTNIKDEINVDNEELSSAIDTFKILDGSEESEDKVKKEAGFGLELLSSMDLNQPIVTCTNRQVLRSSADSQFLVISYNTNPNDEIKKTEYFKLVKEDQGGLTIGDIKRRFISYHDIETKIITGDENLDC